MLGIITFIFSSSPDTLSWESARQIMETQRSVANTTVLALAVLIAVLGIATWIWNFRLQKEKFINSQKLLESSINDELKEAKESLIKESTEKSKEVTTQLKTELTGLIDARLKEVIGKNEKNILFLQADLSRTAASVNMQLEGFYEAALWLPVAITNYSKLGSDYGDVLRDAIKKLIDSLNSLKVDQKFTEKDRQHFAEVLDYIPLSLKPERDQIEAKLKELNVIPK